MQIFSYLLLFIALISTSYANTNNSSDYLKNKYLRHWSKAQGVPNAILCIHQSKAGFIWIGTYEGLFKYDGYEFKKYSVRNTPSLKHNTIWSLAESQEGTLWIGTEKGVLKYKNGIFQKVTKTEHFVYSLYVTQNNNLYVGTRGHGVWKYNPATQNYEEINAASNQLKSVDVLSILEKDKTIWLGTNKGIFKFYDNKIQSFAKSFTIKNGQSGSLVETLHLDNNNKIWAGTNVGLFYIQNDSLFNEPHFNGYQIFRLKSDKKNVLWVGTSDGLFFYKNNEKPTAFSYGKNTKFHLHAFLEDKEGNWWIGTLRSGLFQILENQFININKNLETPQIGSLGFDKEGKLLIGSVNGKVSRWNNINNNVKPWFETQSSGRVYYILSDSKQNTWIATYNGLTKISSDGKSTVLTSKDGLSGGLFRYIQEDKKGNYWIGTRDGGISVLNENNKVLKKWNTSNGLSSNFIMSIETYNDEGTLVSTAGGGINLLMDDSIFVLKQEHGLSSNVIFDTYTDKDMVIWAVSTLGLDRIEWQPNEQEKKWKITNFGIKQKIPDESPFSYLEDDLGFVWMPSASGIIRVSKESLNLFSKDSTLNITWELFTSEDGLTSTNCAGATHAAKDLNGNLYFPTFNGAIAVDPSNFINSSTKGPSVYITEFHLNQKLTEKKEQMKLPPGPHRISFKFTSPYFTNHDKISLKYKLKGIDPDWIEASKERVATYTNIGFGKYIFEVKSINKENKWKPQIINWSFSVQPHFYETVWFLVICVILLVLAVFGLFRLRMRKLQMAKIRLETTIEKRTAQIASQKSRIEKQAEQLQNLDKLKSRFFANISHDLRTPLTLVLGHTHNLINKYKNHTDLVQELNVAQKNGKHLLRLVEEILDLSKIESDSLNFNEKPLKLYPFLSRIIDNFRSLLQHKNIVFIINYEGDQELTVEIDKNYFEKIIYNLLSNAAKFTEEGAIELIVKTSISNDNKNAKIEIEVNDTGCGIDKQDLEYIFNRYYQSQENTVPVNGGTGIGLALVKELVELMNGSINVESEKGKGSQFILTLTKKISTLNKVDINQDTEEKENIDLSNHQNTSNTISIESSSNGAKNQSIMIVEDHEDMRNFIAKLLSPHYHIIVAMDGKNALEKLEKHSVDLIISDVMMPNMDGFEFLKTLKNHSVRQFIPTIMLTARAGIDDKLNAFSIGVNDYLIKPFEPQELLFRIKNLLLLKKERKIWQNKVALKKNEKPLSVDDKFILNATEIVKKSLTDSRFNVVQFADDLAMSQRQLTRKIRMLTGFSPLQYINEIRLQEAKKMLEHKEKDTVSEIMFSVGFKTTGHFADIYKKRFGKLPSSYFEDQLY